MSTKNYEVTGMTCGHCVASVKEEVGEVPGVHEVDVDLESGRVTVSGHAFTDAAVAAAVEEAGYKLVSEDHLNADPSAQPDPSKTQDTLQ